MTRCRLFKSLRLNVMRSSHLSRALKQIWSKLDKHNADESWFSCFTVAVSRQVHDGRGTQRHQNYSAGAAWGSRLCPGGQLRRAGGDPHEPPKMATALRRPPPPHRPGALGRRKLPTAQMPP